jgi:hypothetical protein
VFGIVYVGSRKESRDKIIDTEWSETSGLFRGFIECLGSMVKENGYEGIIADEIVDLSSRLIVWRDLRYEVLYEVAPLMNKSVDKWKYLKESHVLIFWTEKRSFKPGVVLKENCYVCITISPSDSDEDFRIYVKKRDSAIGFGLVDDVLIVSRQFLGFVVMWTAIFANIAVEKYLKVGVNEEKVESPESFWKKIPARNMIDLGME